MGDQRAELAERVIGYLVELNGSTCSITDESILQEEDEVAREILSGFLLLHEELQLREQERRRAVEALESANRALAGRVEAQMHAIRELSTPVLEIWEGVLVLPVIGAVDTMRGEQILGNLLNAISRSGARAAILDVTGVPVVDTAVAAHFLRAIQAAQLLGAEVVLTGVRPHTAQALTQLGVDLSSVVTQGTLMAGLRHVLKHA